MEEIAVSKVGKKQGKIQKDYANFVELRVGINKREQ
jgi:hypothetical protein